MYTDSDFAFQTEGKCFGDVLDDILFALQFRAGPYMDEGYTSEEIRQVANEDIQTAMLIFGFAN